MLNLIIKSEDLFSKLHILSRSAKYDKAFITDYTYTSGGKCVPILKILFTNFCKNDCKYCYNRRSNDIKRTCFNPDELARITVELFKKGYIKGLFLSSGIYGDPDTTMELMIKAVKILRKKYDFRGYIHLKILPGTCEELIKKGAFLADRLSCNVELPTQKSLKLLAPDKNKQELLKTLTLIKKISLETEKPISSTTQLIVGATSDSDKTILKFARNLYRNNIVKRVYYSAYVPVNKDPDLPKITEPPYKREYRLYQADWLLRFYGFTLEELFEKEENLDVKVDPKIRWANFHPEFFPVDLCKADYWELIRVPGIGIKNAKKIIKIRKSNSLNEEVLKRLGISLSKIGNFVVIKGKPLKKVKHIYPIFKYLKKQRNV